MKQNIEVILKVLNSNGITCKYIEYEYVEPFIKVTNCGLLDRYSVADYIRKNGFNCDID